MAKNKQNSGGTFALLRSLTFLAAVLLLLDLNLDQVRGMAIRNKGRFPFIDEVESQAETKSSSESQPSAANATEQANSSQSNESTQANMSLAAVNASSEVKAEAATSASEAQSEVLRAYNDSMSVRAVLNKYKGEFTGDVFESLLTQQELPHLLFSELQALTKRLGDEFPDVIQVGAFGQSWEHRDLLYIKLDARHATGGNVSTSLAESTPAKPEKKKNPYTEDDDLLDKAFGPNMGNIFVQVDQEVKGIKQSLQKNMKRVNLAQTRHIDSRLMQSGDEEDAGVSMSETGSDSKKADKSSSEADAPKALEQSASSSEGGQEQPQNLEQINYGPDGPPAPTDTRALLVTGATHARELLSSQVPLYLCLKLLHQGYIQNVTQYQKMLQENVFYFVPVINVDGSALVERVWLAEKKILNKRKNMNPRYHGSCGDEDSGTDLNRNYGVDWTAASSSNHTELCGDYWPGDQAFSEPETRAFRDFVAQRKQEIKFIINCHTSGNQFVWPFNGRAPNDIESRAPGYLAIFQDIDKNAPFPYGTLKGNSYEVIGDKMGGDADDYMLATFGIPAITAEMGFFGQYIKDWRCQSKQICHDIIRENIAWMEYVVDHLSMIGQVVKVK